ncbi:hypothetical protein HY634_01645, partial [Candidatus Uhrbacteria bacterium]|nr:hypothetical protein [Candidatus Uhrbacteria bacterium]
KYADKWWTMFGEYLTIGPVLAFFLWLALVSVGTGTVGQDIRSGAVGGSQADADALAGATGAIPTQAATPDALMSFVIAICMLVAGMKIAGEMGVMGAGAMKGAADKMAGVAKWGAKKFTGYRYASERISGAWKMHEQARQEGVKADASKLYQGYGAVVAAPGKLIGKIPTVGTAFDRRAAKLEQQAQAAGGNTKKAKELYASARRWRAGGRWSDRAVAVGSVVAAPFTGGASLVGLAGVAGKGGKALQRHGEAARAAGRDYKYKEVKASLDTMKDMTPEQVKQQRDDPTKSNADRMAAFLHATQKGWASGADVKGGEGWLRSLGADDKTVSTFRSYAGERLGGSLLSTKEERPERQRRLREGEISLKNLKPDEVTDADFAMDIALNTTPEQQKELSKTTEGKAKWQEGLKEALGKATGEERAKLAEMLVRAGGSPADAYGSDVAAFGTAVAGKGGGAVVSSLDLPSLRTDSYRSAIKQHATPAGLKDALKRSYDDGDTEKAAEIGKLIDEMVDGLSKSPELQTVDRWRADSKRAEDKVGTVRQNRNGRQGDVDRLKQTLAGAAPGSARHTDLSAQLTEATRQLTEAQGDLTAAEQQLRDSQKDLQEEEQRYAESISRRTQLRNVRKNA